MSHTAQMSHTTERGRELISNLNRIRPDVTYDVTTEQGTIYKIRLNPNPPGGFRADSGKTHLLVSMNGAAEVPQYAQAVIREGEGWEIHPQHTTSPIVSVELARAYNA